MRVLGAVVFAQALLVASGQAQAGLRRSIGTKAIGDHKLRREALLPEQLSHEFHRGRCVAPPLDEKIKDFTLVVDGAP